jgi:hypothetical protein
VIHAIDLIAEVDAALNWLRNYRFGPHRKRQWLLQS